jgi:hypothetical protein
MALMAGRRGDCWVGLGPIKVEVMAVFLKVTWVDIAIFRFFRFFDAMWIIHGEAASSECAERRDTL